MSRHPERTAVFDLPISPLSRAEIVALVRDPLPRDAAGPRRIHTANLDHVVKLRHDAAFRDAYRDAWLVTADGMPVYLYARWRIATPVHRVTGSDLLPDLLKAIDPDVARPFFLCSTAELAEGITAKLIRDGYPAQAIATAVPPFGFERDDAYSRALARQIADHRTTHLFLGVGAPKSEIWASRYRDLIGPCYVLAIGAGIEFLIGKKSRAPRLVQRAGMEWMWRLASEPRRLARRYLVDSWAFALAVATDLKTSERGQNP